MSPSRARRLPDKIEHRKLSELIPYARNARAHSPAQVEEIAASIKRFGFVNPVLVGEDGVIIAGHGRVLGAARAKLTEAPVIVLTGLSESERRALALADNRIALNSSWDAEMLRLELEAIQDAGDPLAGLGFADDELEAILGDLGEDAPEVKEIDTGPVEDRFWISIRGPLADQAVVLQRLTEAMKDLGEVAIELGTIAVDF